MQRINCWCWLPPVGGLCHSTFQLGFGLALVLVVGTKIAHLGNRQLFWDVFPQTWLLALIDLVVSSRWRRRQRIQGAVTGGGWRVAGGGVAALLRLLLRLRLEVCDFFLPAAPSRGVLGYGHPSCLLPPLPVILLHLVSLPRHCCLFVFHHSVLPSLLVEAGRHGKRFCCWDLRSHYLVSHLAVSLTVLEYGVRVLPTRALGLTNGMVQLLRQWYRLTLSTLRDFAT